MLASLLIAASLWGTDPHVVFKEDAFPWANRLVTDDQSELASMKQTAESKDNRQMPTPLVVRAQTVTDDITEPSPQPGYAEFWENPFVKEFITGMNPFVQEEPHTLPNYYDPFSFQMKTGSNGPQGYRMGWVSYNDFTLLPASQARGTTGSLKIVEWNSNAKYSHMIAPGVLFNGTFIFNARWWDGPDGTNLPGQVDQISSDLELGFFNDGPWSGQIAFHPQIVESYEARLDRNAFNFDGRAIATYAASPQMSYVMGLAIWDRVNTLVVPHAGVVWTPNDRWEFRILYPKSRISYFLGNRWNADFWLYATAEYTAEAWQSSVNEPRAEDRLQITDDRVTLGLRWDLGRYSFFTEGGFVFNRRVKFAGSTPPFDLDNSGMFRVGLRY